MSGGEIVAKGLFDDDALPAGFAVFGEHTRFFDLFDDFTELARHGCQVKQDISANGFTPEGSELLFELFVGLRIGHVAEAIKDVLGEFLPDFFIDGFGAGELIERLAQFLTPRGIRFFAAREADDAIIRGHLLFLVQMIQGRDEFARSEIAACTEDDNRAGLDWFARFAEPAVGFSSSILIHAQTMAEGRRNFNG